MTTLRQARQALEALQETAGDAQEKNFHLFVGISPEQVDAIRRDIDPGDYALLIMRPRQGGDAAGPDPSQAGPVVPDIDEEQHRQDIEAAVAAAELLQDDRYLDRPR